MRKSFGQSVERIVGTLNRCSGFIGLGGVLRGILLIALLHDPARVLGATPSSPDSVSLGWNANPESDIASYQVNYGTTAGSHPDLVQAGANTSVTVTGLVEGTTYFFVVSATNRAGQQSASSSEVSYQLPVTAITLAEWAAAANLTALNTEPLAIPQHDGVANLLKYAFGMNGNGPDVRVMSSGTGTAGLPFIALDRSGATPVLHIEYLRRKNSLLIYTPRKSFDLQTWQPLTTTSLSVTDIDAEWERVVIAEPCDRTVPICLGRVEVMLSTL